MQQFILRLPSVGGEEANTGREGLGKVEIWCKIASFPGFPIVWHGTGSGSPGNESRSSTGTHHACFHDMC